jgi:hypothetical protein
MIKHVNIRNDTNLSSISSFGYRCLEQFKTLFVFLHIRHGSSLPLLAQFNSIAIDNQQDLAVPMQQLEHEQVASSINKPEY